MEKLLGLPEVASAHGPQIDAVIGYVHWLMAVMFVGWTALFLYMLFRFRRGAHPKASYEGTKGKAAKFVEVGVVVAELILLIGFSIPLWSERVDDFPAESESTVVRVIGEQFAWNVHYPGPDGQFGRTKIDLVDTQTNPLGLDSSDPAAKDDIITLNQLHLPVGKPVIVHLSSKDVIHSFMLPEMRVKQDAIPGLETPVWFIPTVTTDEMRQRKGQSEFNYEIACAQLCGLGHYRMRGFLHIDTPEQYKAWLAEQAPSEDEGGSSVWD
jgi:cytochrome c oxidase subunit 2